ncbi:hypothetical protein [Hyperthermus butylicus]|uniref:Uncharacterized protein n=1 Tax=Hyperthermus butylicus (strain DSM 5456 / JCM 9403 / PLM1-5) TaxID=415426 RepID=A2BKM0_HYPBU|nr:hypothetical protein [Hyperthermus butylicus]ABM80531.1 hypothetical protein Hbut_0675 [Hyperthermus butylicus DSM 5456]
MDLVIARFREESEDVFANIHLKAYSVVDGGASSSLRAVVTALEAYESLGLPLDIIDRLNIVVIGGSGGFQVDHLISLDVEHLANNIVLLANTLHELAHIWISSTLKPERPEDLWLSEALPDFLMVRALQTLGYSETAQRIISKNST